MRPLLVALVLMSVVAAPAMGQEDTDYKITPGYAVGGISVGMGLDQALTVLGRPQSSRPATGPSVLPIPNGAREYVWSNGLAIMVAHNTLYTVALVGNVHYFLPNELHVGVIGRNVRAVMGNPPRIVSAAAWTGWAYDNQGVAFYFRHDRSSLDESVVFQIDVYRPRTTN